MIVRTKKNRNYTVINNTVLEDERLSFRARGIAALLLSKPDNWEISHEYLWKHGAEGRDAILKAMKELEDCGYLVRTRLQQPDGKFTTLVTMHEEPQEAQPTTAFQQSVNQDSVNQKSVNQQSVFQDSIVSTDKQVLKTSTDKQVLIISDAPKHATPQQEMFGAICAAIGWDHKTISKKDAGMVAQTVGALTKAEYTVEDIRQFMIDIWFKDWRWEKKRQHPTLSQLRQEIGKLRSVVASVAPSTGMDGYRKMLHEQGIHI
jgi:hypothetical protein